MTAQMGWGPCAQSGCAIHVPRTRREYCRPHSRVRQFAADVIFIGIPGLLILFAPAALIAVSIR